MRIAQLTLSAAVVIAMSACTSKKPTEEAWREVVTAIPWMMKMLEHCEAYKQVKKETDKTAVYHRTQRIMKRARVKKVRGVVDKVMGNKPVSPDEYSLQVNVGGKVLFASQSSKRPIKRGGNAFKQVSTLKEGQCVIFSARDLEPLATFEGGKVCNFRYYAKFTNVSPCQP